MTKTIYVITSGEYSDYQVEGVCADKATADRWVAITESAGLSHRIEEFEIVDTSTQLRLRWSAEWDLYRDTDLHPHVGVPTRHHEEPWIEVELVIGGAEIRHRTETIKMRGTSLRGPRISYRAEGPDRDRVVKSVRDRLMAQKASSWPEQEGA